MGPARDPASAQAALDGVIASSMATDALEAFRGTDLPLVMLDSDPAGTGAAAHVNLDVADGMRRVTEHLLGLGHRRFLHLASAARPGPSTSGPRRSPGRCAGRTCAPCGRR